MAHSTVTRSAVKVVDQNEKQLDHRSQGHRRAKDIGWKLKSKIKQERRKRNPNPLELGSRAKRRRSLFPGRVLQQRVVVNVTTPASAERERARVRWHSSRKSLVRRGQHRLKQDFTSSFFLLFWSTFRLFHFFDLGLSWRVLTVCCKVLGARL